MSGIRELSQAIALATLWEELVFTWARLHARTSTKEYATVYEELIARCEKTELAQRAHWRAEALADAAVDLADEELDEVSDEVVAEVRHADRKGDDAREQRYLGALTLGALVRLGLESQLKRVRAWVPSLESEPEDGLRKLGRRLAKVITGGDAALTQRVDAAAARASHRARDIRSLVADVNAARRDTYGALVRLGNRAKRAKDWPERFFRKGTAAKTARGDDNPDPPPNG